MKKILGLLLALLMLFAMTSASLAEYTAGTYTGVSPNGKDGEIVVEVTLSDSAIESITITRQTETPGISDPAINEIPGEIVKYQSLGVDTITGCTVTCDAIIEAVADAVAQAGGDVEALKAVEVVRELSTEVIDLNADMVVVGGGAAGLSAAVTAAETGAHVILLEKTGSLGGNAIISGGWIEYIDIAEDLRAKNNEGYQGILDDIFANGPLDEQEAAIWPQLTAEYEAYKAKGVDYVFDSNLFLAVDYHRIESLDLENYLGYGALINDFDAWLTGMGAEWYVNGGIVGYQWPRWNKPKGFTHGVGYFTYLQNYIQEKNLNIDIYLNTPATDLITDEAGTVTGVVATAKSGEIYNITSKKGVLLCSGGFSANGKMMVQYNTMWEGMTENIRSDNNPGNTGDGIVMAQKLGAMTAAMDNEMLFPSAGAVTGSTEAIVGGTLFVNTEGKRFVDETLDRFSICRAIFKQPGEFMYQIGDAKSSGIVDGHTVGGTDINIPLANGELKMADTLDELAEKIGADPEVFKATIAKHNESCASFVDEDFGRTIYKENATIDTAPFTAYATAPVAHITIGGIVTTGNGEVITTEGTLIPGLYAAGEVVCGQCGISAFAYGRGVAKYMLAD